MKPRTWRILKTIWILLAAFVTADLAGAVLYGPPRAIAIEWPTVYQTIDGFGSPTADNHCPIPRHLMDFFYSSSGIGLNLIRVKVYPDFESCAAETTYCPPYVQAAGGNSATVWAAMPASMKTSQAFAGGAILGNPASYLELSAIMVSYFKLLTGTHHIPIYTLSVQNEPDMDISRYESTAWTAPQIHDYLPYLKNALNVARYGDTKLMVAEQSSWKFDRATDAMCDPSTARLVDILAAHTLRAERVPSSPPDPAWTANRRVWETDMSCGGEPTMALSATRSRLRVSMRRGAR